MSVESKAAALKNVAYAVGILAAIAVAVYLLKQGKKVVEQGEKAAGYLFGGDSAPSTLGTDIYDMTHAAPSYYDETAAINACNLAWARSGELRSETCQRLRAEGKLTPP